jgi:pimeloyl-ACP methyl ester carboxylesterase
MSPAEVPVVVYVHGAGNKPPRDDLKLAWDLDLFGRDMGQATRMAHYADLLHPTPGAVGADACTQDQALAALVLAASAVDASAGKAPLTDEADLLAGLTPRGQQLALSLSMSIAAQAASRPPTVQESLEAVLPLPPSLRRLLLRQLLHHFFPDADAYFFTDRKEPIRERLRQALNAVDGPAVVIGHSLGTVIAYDVLSESSFITRAVPLLVTLGSPLGYTEIQDVVTKPLQLPRPVQLWANFADPLDLVTLDTGLADDFQGAPRIIDARVDNPSPNHHAVCGYLGASKVRSTVNAAVPAVLSG